MSVRASLIANCFVAACLATACGADDAENAEVTGVANDDDDGASTGDESNSSNVSASTTSVTTGQTSTTSTSTTDATSTSTTTTTTTTTTDPDTSSSETSDTDCPPGEDGCPCDAAGECDGSLVCLGEICGEAGECGVDLFEANNTERTASDLGDFGSADDKEGTELTAVLDGSDDVDWFFYDGTDGNLSFVDPARELNTVGGLRLCKYVECDNGLLETDVTCPEGTAMATSPENRPGCCGDDGFEIELNCEGVIGDDARVYMRVDQAQQECVQYTIDYHY